MDYISEKISRDPVTGKLYVGKKPGDDQAPETAASGTSQPEKKGANFSIGGVDPKTKKGFLGVQPGRDPADTFTGRMANRFIPRLDKETGRVYMGTQVGKDPKPADKATVAVGTPATGTPSQDAKDRTAAPKTTTTFGAAFKAARENRLAGKSGDTFEYGGKKYTSYQKGEEPKATPKIDVTPKSGNATQTLPGKGNPVTATADKAKLGGERLDSMIAGGVMKSLPSSATQKADNDPNFRYSTDKVSTTTSRNPGENSTTTTRNSGTTSTRSVSGGGSTEIKRNDTRTPAEKASDEAKDKAAADAQVAAAQKKYDDRQKVKKSSTPGSPVSESIANYKNAFRAALTEGEVVPFRKPSTAQVVQRTTASSGSSTRSGNRSGASQKPKTGSTFNATKDWAKRNLNVSNAGKAVRFGTGLAGGALVGMGSGYIANSLLTSVASKITGTDYNADVAKARGDDLAAAALTGAPEGVSWAAGGAAMDKIRGVAVKGNLARGAAVAAGVGAGDYVRSKTANTPFAPLGRIAGSTLTAGGYGAGVYGAPGAGVGAAGGFGHAVGKEFTRTEVGKRAVNVASRDIETLDTALGNPLTRGIRDQGEKDRAKLKAMMDKKRQQTSTIRPESPVDRVRARQQPGPNILLKKPTQ